LPSAHTPGSPWPIRFWCGGFRFFAGGPILVRPPHKIREPLGRLWCPPFPLGSPVFPLFLPGRIGEKKLDSPPPLIFLSFPPLGGRITSQGDLGVFPGGTPKQLHPCFQFQVPFFPSSSGFLSFGVSLPGRLFPVATFSVGNHLPPPHTFFASHTKKVKRNFSRGGESLYNIFPLAASLGFPPPPDFFLFPFFYPPFGFFGKQPVEDCTLIFPPVSFSLSFHHGNFRFFLLGRRGGSYSFPGPPPFFFLCGFSPSP